MQDIEVNQGVEALPPPRVKRSSWTIQKTVLFALILRELKTRFGEHRLGAVWLLLEPTLHITLLLLVFSFIGGRGFYNFSFPVFLLTGIVPFLLFKNIALRVMDGVDANKALFAYRHVKPMDAFVARALLEFTLYVAVFFVMSAAFVWMGIQITLVKPLEFAVVMMVLGVLGLGLGLIFGVIAHAFPPMRLLIRLSFMPLYFISGIFFPITVIPVEYRSWLMWNPLLHAIELSRSSFSPLYHLDQGISLGYVFAAAILSLFVGFWLYRQRRLAMVAS
ncbi:MAG: ABC transporter permease [Pseudomonadota bacterium]